MQLEFSPEKFVVIFHEVSRNNHSNCANLNGKYRRLKIIGIDRVFLCLAYTPSSGSAHPS